MSVLPIKKIELYHEGIERPTTLSLRDASPGGPAKFDWSISQDYGKNEVKLTHEQMGQLCALVRDWIINK